MNAGFLTDKALDVLFREAHTANGWLHGPVDEKILNDIYDLMKFGPTSANSCPLRIVFVKEDEGKARLKPFLDKGNVDKTMSAPVTAIFAYDTQFYNHLPLLFPHTDAKSWFIGNDRLIQETAFRNSSLQAAYFIIAARACGLDCAPMSGFDKEKLNAEFFPDGRYKANFICALGYADPTKTHKRNPRLAFDEVCSFV